MGFLKSLKKKGKGSKKSSRSEGPAERTRITVSETFTQINHGFFVGQVLCRSNDGGWTPSSSNDAAGVVGVVSAVLDNNTFTLVFPKV